MTREEQKVEGFESGSCGAPSNNVLDRSAQPLTVERPFSALVESEWQTLLAKDDRTSPEEYPEMLLITRSELAGAMSEAWFLANEVDPQEQVLRDAARDLLGAAKLAFVGEVGRSLALKVERAGWQWPDDAPAHVSSLAEALRAAIAKAEGL